MAGAASIKKEISVVATMSFPGFKFSPTDVELISYYLRRKIDGHENSVQIIPEVDIYNFEPWDLPEKAVVRSESEWFFFCARGRKYPHGSQNRRATVLGYWKATGKERNVKSGSEIIGTKRTLVFHVGRAPKGERTEWLMHEYCLNGVPQDSLVVCRLRKNEEFRASSSKIQTSDLPCYKDARNNILENGSDPSSISEWENMVEFYISTESGQELLKEATDSENVEQNNADEDFFAEIMNDDIVKLDEAALFGPPLLPRANAVIPAAEPVEDAAVSRVLPLPDFIDRRIRSMMQGQHPSNNENHRNNDKDEKGEDSGKGSLSSCFVGLYSIKTKNRNRWDGVFMGIIVVALLLYLVTRQVK